MMHSFTILKPAVWAMTLALPVHAASAASDGAVNGEELPWLAMAAAMILLCRMGICLADEKHEPEPILTNSDNTCPFGGEGGDQNDWDDFWQQRKRRPLGRLLAWGRRRFVTPALVKLLDRNTECGVLAEAGCGSGEVTLRLAGRRGDRVILIDTSRRALSLAMSNARSTNIDATPLECDVRELRAHLPDDDICHVQNIGVIEHFEDPSEVLRQMAWCSRKWALAVIPERGLFWRVFITLAKGLRLAPDDMYVYLHNKDTLSKALRDAGLEPLGFCRTRILGLIPYLGIRFRKPLTNQKGSTHAADV